MISRPMTIKPIMKSFKPLLESHLHTTSFDPYISGSDCICKSLGRRDGKGGGVKQSVRSNFRTICILVYKRSSSNTPGMIVHSDMKT